MGETINKRVPSGSLDAENPWPGASAYTEAMAPWFHGREEQVQQLFRRVKQEAACVLQGGERTGKTSLLQAGLFPKLREEGFLPVYMRLDCAEAAIPPAAQMKFALHAACLAAGIRVRDDPDELWRFIQSEEAELKDEAGNQIVPVFVFDQCEKCFTSGTESVARQQCGREFLAELSHFLEKLIPKPTPIRNRVRSKNPATAFKANAAKDPEMPVFRKRNRRAVFSIQEEHAALLHAWLAPLIPVRLSRTRINDLTGVEARGIVTGAGRGLVDEATANEIVRLAASGEEQEVDALSVPPGVLNVLCERANALRIDEGAPCITREHLRHLADEGGGHDSEQQNARTKSRLLSKKLRRTAALPYLGAAGALLVLGMIWKHGQHPPASAYPTETFTAPAMRAAFMSTPRDAARETPESTLKEQARQAPDDVHIQRALAMEYARTGETLQSQQKLPEALEAFREGLHILQRLAAKEPADNALKKELSTSWENVGDVLSATQQTGPALDAYVADIKLLGELGEQASSRSLAADYRKLGEMLLREKKLDEALTAFRQDLALLEKMDAKSLDAASQGDLALSQERIGEVLATKGRWDEALHAFGEGKKLRQKLAETDPNDSEALRSLSYSCQSIGEALTAQGKVQDALTIFKECMDLRQKLARSEFDMQAQHDYALACLGVAWVELLCRDPASAVSVSERGLAADRAFLVLNTNIAHGYLFENRFEDARNLYLKYKDVRVNNGRTFAEIVLDDFKEFEKRGLRHPDIAKIAKLMAEP